MDMTEIQITAPKCMKILVPRQIIDEFERLVREEDLSRFITEALRDELKKIRFRTQLENALLKVA
jgi:rRNA-processing protein FCF1